MSRDKQHGSRRSLRKDADLQSGAGLLVILQMLIVPHPGDTEMADEDLGVISMLFIANWKVCLQP